LKRHDLVAEHNAKLKAHKEKYAAAIKGLVKFRADALAKAKADEADEYDSIRHADAAEESEIRNWYLDAVKAINDEEASALASC